MMASALEVARQDGFKQADAEQSRIHSWRTRIVQIRNSLPGSKEPAAYAVQSTQRTSLSPKRRFQIMRRDGYRCQICGRTAQESVRLEIDHIEPVREGGTDLDENLWTLCEDCNRGKGADHL